MSTVEAESQSSFPWAVLIVALILFVLIAICLVVMCTKKKIKKVSLTPAIDQ